MRANYARIVFFVTRIVDIPLQTEIHRGSPFAFLEASV